MKPINNDDDDDEEDDNKFQNRSTKINIYIFLSLGKSYTNFGQIIKISIFLREKMSIN